MLNIWHIYLHLAKIYGECRYIVHTLSIWDIHTVYTNNTGHSENPHIQESHAMHDSVGRNHVSEMLLAICWQSVLDHFEILPCKKVQLVWYLIIFGTLPWWKLHVVIRMSCEYTRIHLLVSPLCDPKTTNSIYRYTNPVMVLPSASTSLRKPLEISTTWRFWLAGRSFWGVLSGAKKHLMKDLNLHHAHGNLGC